MITLWTVKMIQNSQNPSLYLNLDSNPNHPSTHTKVFWTSLTITKTQICWSTDNDTKVEISKWKTKYLCTSKSLKLQKHQARKDSLIICTYRVFSKADATKQQLTNGDVVDQKRLILWVYCIGKWMIFGKDPPGLVWNMAVDGNLYTTQLDELLLQL
jgi:hypothetical protein